MERQFAADAHISLAYVANKGTRLNSSLGAVNVLDPSLLSMGGRLFDEF